MGNMDYEKIIQNLKTARTVLEAAPVDQIDLCFFAHQHKCGTLYCSLGWLAVSEHFKHIMKLVWQDPVALKAAKVVPVDFVDTPGFDRSVFFKWLDEHFGPSAFDVLFKRRCDGELDVFWFHEIFSGQDGGLPVDLAKIDNSDRALALWRIDRQIERVQQKMRAPK